MPELDTLWAQSLTDIAIALRNESVSSRDLLEFAHARHDQYGDKLNAYLTWSPDTARHAADAADAAFAAGTDLGALQGLPVSVKDLYGIEGYPTYAGSGKRLPPAWEREGPVVHDIRAQLAVITGKTHTVEFAAGGIGDNIHWGAPWNPWDAENPRGPGGSSSGAGISLWEGSALAAFGTDTMGSVRIPAAMSGVVGLKITQGRWSNDGIVPLREAQDTPGPLTRSVADAAYIFAAFDSHHRNQPDHLLNELDRAVLSQFTLGIADPCFWDDCAPGVTEAVQSALKELEAAGARIIDAPSPATAELIAAVMSGALGNAELIAFLETELPEWIDQLGEPLRSRIKAGNLMSAVELIKEEKWLAKLRSAAASEFGAVDVMVAPTVPISPPVLIDGKPPPVPGSPPIIGARNTCPANFLQQCAISMPVGLDTDQMPVGLQMTAPGGGEERLLAVACAAEKVLGTATDRLGTPPLLNA